MPFPRASAVCFLLYAFLHIFSINPTLPLNRHARSPHSVIMRQLQHSYWQKWRTFSRIVIFERNPKFEARLHLSIQKNQNRRFFPAKYCFFSPPLFRKNISPKSQSKSCTDIFPLNVRHFPQNKKPHRRKTSDCQEASAKNSEIYVDPPRYHIVYCTALKRRDDRVADCA